MDDEEPIPFQHRFVADADTAAVLARASVAQVHRKPPLWVLYGIFWVVVLVIGQAVDDDGTTVVASVLWSLLPTVVLVIGLSASIYINNRRTTRARAFAGAVLESGFGEDALVTRNPTSSARIAYTAVQSIDVHGPAVFLMYDGSPVVHMYPRELFPDAEIERLRQHAASRR